MMVLCEFYGQQVLTSFGVISGHQPGSFCRRLYHHSGIGHTQSTSFSWALIELTSV